MAEAFTDEQIETMSDPKKLQLFMAKNEWVEEGDDHTYEVIFANPSFVKFARRFLATITADRKRIEELENREKSILKTANAEVKKSIDQTAVIERLKGALEYYANDFNWSQRDWNDPEDEPQVVLYPEDPMKNGWEPARQALDAEKE